MLDPLEGVSSLGTIETGARRDRVSTLFEPVLDEGIAAVGAANRDSSLYAYGSVATGAAQAGTSDVDLLTVGLPAPHAADIARALSARFLDLCRAVTVAPAKRSDFLGATDQAYGGRVFLRHCCVHLAGPDLHSALPDFAADVRAARGFNGDIAQSAKRWRTELADGGDPVQLSRRLARKTLLAVAGLVSVHDGTWTTDRAGASTRWSEIEPALAGGLRTLVAWSHDSVVADRESVEAALDGVLAQLTESFRTSIGFWNSIDG